MAPIANFYRLKQEIARQRHLPIDTYISEARNALINLRDNGPIPRQDFSTSIEDRGVNAILVQSLLQKYRLAIIKRGYWWLID